MKYLFSTAVIAVVVAKLIMIGILFLTSFNLALTAVAVVVVLVKSGIFSSIFLILALCFF